MASNKVDPAMKKATQLFEQSGTTLDAIGIKMGYPVATARKSDWQFLNKTADPPAVNAAEVRQSRWALA